MPRTTTLDNNAVSIGFKKILAAVDGSPASYIALKYATDLAKNKGAELSIIYVISELISESIPITSPTAIHRAVTIPKSFYDESKMAAEQWIRQLAAKAMLLGVTKAKGEVLYMPSKSVVEMITTYAKNNDIDLIIMGTTGRGTFKRLLLGSIANGVLNHAPCSVLVIR